MARIKILLPEKFSFSCKIPVRITDINYGGHVGNDSVLSIIHEARMQFLHHYGYSEMDLAGAGMIMADVAIEFKGELFYGDIITASVIATDFSKIGFNIMYLLEKETNEIKKTIAYAKTGMICYDYSARKIVIVPEVAKKNLQH
ncbi:MAG: thioesterase family protein [Chitinophagaceae bacterium]|nr:thioesterase family protein [Chitinophagaceae bacterium]